MNKKNINKLITAAVIIIAIIIFIPNLNFKSVKKYNEEQEKLVSEQLSKEKADKSDNGQLLFDKSGEKPDNGKSGNDDKTNFNNNEKSKDNNSTLKISDKDSKKDITDKKDTTEKNKYDKKSDNNGSDKKSDNKTVKKSKSDNNKTDKNNKADQKKDKNHENKKDDNSEYITCNVSIDCTSVRDKLDLLKPSVRKHIPASGIILKESKIKVKKSSNAYDVLVTACKLNKIAYDAEYSKVYSSTYVKGIGYLYEKMAGDMSGWLYLVNGKTANVGASRYTVNEGDTVSWTYTCSGRAGS